MQLFRHQMFRNMSFDGSLRRGINGLTCYKYNIKTLQKLSAIKYKILSENTTNSQHRHCQWAGVSQMIRGKNVTEPLIR